MKHQQLVSSQPVNLLDRLSKALVREKSRVESLVSELKVSLTEHSGVLYLKLHGFAGSLHRKELQRVFKGVLSRHYSQMIINIEDLRFASEKSAATSRSYLKKLSFRMHRLQIVTIAESETHSMLKLDSGNRFLMPRFELLLKRR